MSRHYHQSCGSLNRTTNERPKSNSYVIGGRHHNNRNCSFSNERSQQYRHRDERRSDLSYGADRRRNSNSQIDSKTPRWRDETRRPPEYQRSDSFRYDNHAYSHNPPKIRRDCDRNNNMVPLKKRRWSPSSSRPAYHKNHTRSPTSPLEDYRSPLVRTIVQDHPTVKIPTHVNQEVIHPRMARKPGSAASVNQLIADTRKQTCYAEENQSPLDRDSFQFPQPANPSQQEQSFPGSVSSERLHSSINRKPFSGLVTGKSPLSLSASIPPNLSTPMAIRNITNPRICHSPSVGSQMTRTMSSDANISPLVRNRQNLPPEMLQTSSAKKITGWEMAGRLEDWKLSQKLTPTHARVPFNNQKPLDSVRPLNENPKNSEFQANGGDQRNPKTPHNISEINQTNCLDDLSLSERHLLSGSDLGDCNDSSLLDFDLEESEVGNDTEFLSPKLKRRALSSQSPGIQSKSSKASKEDQIRQEMAGEKQEIAEAKSPTSPKSTAFSKQDFEYLSQLLDNSSRQHTVSSSTTNKQATGKAKILPIKQELSPTKNGRCFKMKTAKNSVKSALKRRALQKGRSTKVVAKPSKKVNRQRALGKVPKKKSVKQTQPLVDHMQSEETLSDSCPKLQNVPPNPPGSNKENPPKASCDDVPVNTTVHEDEDIMWTKLLEEQRKEMDQIRYGYLDTTASKENCSNAISTSTPANPLKSFANAPTNNNVSNDVNALESLDAEYEWLDMYAPEEDSVSVYSTKKLQKKSPQFITKANLEKNIPSKSKEEIWIKEVIDQVSFFLDNKTLAQTQMAAETFLRSFSKTKTEKPTQNVATITKRLGKSLACFKQFSYLGRLVQLSIDLSVGHDEDVNTKLLHHMFQQNPKQANNLLQKLLESKLIKLQLAETIRREVEKKSKHKPWSEAFQENNSGFNYKRVDAAVKENRLPVNASPVVVESSAQRTNLPKTAFAKGDYFSEEFLSCHQIQTGTNNRRPPLLDKPKQYRNIHGNKRSIHVTQKNSPQTHGKQLRPVPHFPKSNFKSPTVNCLPSNSFERGGALLPTPPTSQRLEFDPNDCSLKNTSVTSDSFDRVVLQTAERPTVSGYSGQICARRNDGVRSGRSSLKCEAYDPANPAVGYNSKWGNSSSSNPNNKYDKKNLPESRNGSKANNKQKMPSKSIDWTKVGRNFVQLLCTIGSAANEDNILEIFSSALLQDCTGDPGNFVEFVCGAKEEVKSQFPKDEQFVKDCISRIGVTIAFQLKSKDAYNVITYMHKLNIKFVTSVPVNAGHPDAGFVLMKFIEHCVVWNDFFSAAYMAKEFFRETNSDHVSPMQKAMLSRGLHDISRKCILKQMYRFAVLCIQCIPSQYYTGREIEVIENILIQLLKTQAPEKSDNFQLAEVVCDMMLGRNQLSLMRTTFNQMPINEMSLHVYKYLESKGIYSCPRIAQRPHLVFVPYTMGGVEITLTIYRHLVELSNFLWQLRAKLNADLPLRVVLCKNIRNLSPLTPHKNPNEVYSLSIACMKKIFVDMISPPLIIENQVEVTEKKEAMFNIDISSVREWLLLNTAYTE